jgi:transcriptional regulator GlxA family with amidase domain
MSARRAHRTRRVWFVIFPGIELLDLSGPWEVLGHANDLLGYPAYAVELVSPSGGPIATRHGLVLAGSRSLRAAEAAGLPELGIIAGGSPRTPLPDAEARFVRWLRARERRVAHWVSICTGAFVLGEAGLLDGRRAMTHWRWSAQLRARVPRAEVVDSGIFERAGRVWTSAGIAAGIDLCLALVEEQQGHAIAMAVAKNLVLFLRRSGNQAQFSAVLREQSREPLALRGITSFVLDHLHEALPVERLARGLGMSARTLARCCRAELAESPAALVRRLRLEEARRLLEQSELPLKVVARQTGLGDASTLHRVFTQRFALSPAAYRERFAAGLGRGG